MKRYSSSLIGTMLEDENGGWVKYSDHLAAIEQARKEEREVWSKWADAVVAELELRAKINNDPYLEISRLRFVELDTLRARKP